jgi:hypothetical protein
MVLYLLLLLLQVKFLFFMTLIDETFMRIVLDLNYLFKKRNQKETEN